jgi:hypothetical protein
MPAVVNQKQIMQMQTFFTDNFGDIKYTVRFSSGNYKGYSLCKSNTDID